MISQLRSRLYSDGARLQAGMSLDRPTGIEVAVAVAAGRLDVGVDIDVDVDVDVEFPFWAALWCFKPSPSPKPKLRASTTKIMADVTVIQVAFPPCFVAVAAPFS